jgi:hypothetical protein
MIEWEWDADKAKLNDQASALLSKRGSQRFYMFFVCFQRAARQANP